MQNAPLAPGSSIGSPTSPGGDVVVEATRPRQTVRPASPFRDVLAGGTAILARGAEVATSVVAGPAMAAAVRSTGLAAAGAIAGTALAGTTTRPPGTMTAAAGAGIVAGAAPPGAGASGVPASLLAPGSDQSDLATMQAMQRESQVFNMQLLELQEDVQQENRRFSTVSNVLRAKHDTAKAAVANIRA